MKRPSLVIRLISQAIVVVYAFTNVAFAHTPETSVWDERRHQLAALPAQIFFQIPLNRSVLASVSTAPVSFKRKNYHVSESLQNIIDAIPLFNGTIQDIYDSKKESAIVLVQDIHLNAEAQTNIAGVLQGLINQKQIGRIGVEGAFDSFDFSRPRSMADKKLVQSVAADFLNANRIGAHTFVGMTSPVTPPATIGVDDPAHYEANVQAYLDGNDIKDKTLKQIETVRQKILIEKTKYLSPDLIRFDGLRSATLRGQMGFGDYVKSLSQLSASEDSYLVIEQFLSALSMEKTIDFVRVENERTQVLGKLTASLNEKELSALMAESVAYRAGQIGFGDYYKNLKDWCELKHVSLRQVPAFDSYIRYVLLADGIHADSLFQAVEDLETAVKNKLVKNLRDRELIQASEWLDLAEKITTFELTSKQWKTYQSLKPSIQNVALNLVPFEKFYQEADQRSGSMVENLLKDATGADNVLLICGGFHTPDVAAQLKAKNMSYVVVSPKLSKADTKSGSAYLSVFNREKSPIEKLFFGHKLFVNPASVAAVWGIGDVAASGPNAASQLVKAAATQNESANRIGLSIAGAIRQLDPKATISDQAIHEARNVLIYIPARQLGAAVVMLPMVKEFLQFGSRNRTFHIVTAFPEVFKPFDRRVNNQPVVTIDLKDEAGFNPDFGYDLVIDLGHSTEDRSMLTEIPGYPSNSVALYLNIFTRTNLARSLREAVLSLLSEVGFIINGSQPSYSRTEGGDVIFINPHSLTNALTGSELASQWAALIVELLKRNQRVVLSHGVNSIDKMVTRDIEELVKKQTSEEQRRDFEIRKFTLTQLIHFLQTEVRTAVTIDTGIAHLLEAVGVESIVLTTGDSLGWISKTNPGIHPLDHRVFQRSGGVVAVVERLDTFVPVRSSLLSRIKKSQPHIASFIIGMASLFSVFSSQAQSPLPTAATAPQEVRAAVSADDAAAVSFVNTITKIAVSQYYASVKSVTGQGKIPDDDMLLTDLIQIIRNGIRASPHRNSPLVAPLITAPVDPNYFELLRTWFKGNNEYFVFKTGKVIVGKQTINTSRFVLAPFVSLPPKIVEEGSVGGKVNVIGIGANLFADVERGNSVHNDVLLGSAGLNNGVAETVFDVNALRESLGRFWDFMKPYVNAKENASTLMVKLNYSSSQENGDNFKAFLLFSDPVTEATFRLSREKFIEANWEGFLGDTSVHERQHHKDRGVAPFPPGNAETEAEKVLAETTAQLTAIQFGPRPKWSFLHAVQWENGNAAVYQSAGANIVTTMAITLQANMAEFKGKNFKEPAGLTGIQRTWFLLETLASLPDSQLREIAGRARTLAIETLSHPNTTTPIPQATRKTKETNWWKVGGGTGFVAILLALGGYQLFKPAKNKPITKSVKQKRKGPKGGTATLYSHFKKIKKNQKDMTWEKYQTMAWSFENIHFLIIWGIPLFTVLHFFFDTLPMGFAVAHAAMRGVFIAAHIQDWLKYKNKNVEGRGPPVGWKNIAAASIVASINALLGFIPAHLLGSPVFASLAGLPLALIFVVSVAFVISAGFGVHWVVNAWGRSRSEWFLDWMQAIDGKFMVAAKTFPTGSARQMIDAFRQADKQLFILEQRINAILKRLPASSTLALILSGYLERLKISHEKLQWGKAVHILYRGWRGTDVHPWEIDELRQMAEAGVRKGWPLVSSAPLTRAAKNFKQLEAELALHPNNESIKLVWEKAVAALDAARNNFDERSRSYFNNVVSSLPSFQAIFYEQLMIEMNDGDNIENRLLLQAIRADFTQTEGTNTSASLVDAGVRQRMDLILHTKSFLGVLPKSFARFFRNDADVQKHVTAKTGAELSVLWRRFFVRRVVAVLIIKYSLMIVFGVAAFLWSGGHDDKKMAPAQNPPVAHVHERKIAPVPPALAEEIDKVMSVKIRESVKEEGSTAHVETQQKIEELKARLEEVSYVKAQLDKGIQGDLLGVSKKVEENNRTGKTKQKDPDVKIPPEPENWNPSRRPLSEPNAGNSYIPQGTAVHQPGFASSSQKINVGSAGDVMNTWVASRISGHVPGDHYLEENSFNFINPITGVYEQIGATFDPWDWHTKGDAETVIRIPGGPATRSLPVFPNTVIVGLEFEKPSEAQLFFDNHLGLWKLVCGGPVGEIKVSLRSAKPGELAPLSVIKIDPAVEGAWKASLPPELLEMAEIVKTLPMGLRYEVKAKLMSLFMYTQNPLLNKMAEQRNNFIVHAFAYAGGPCHSLDGLNGIFAHLFELPSQLKSGFVDKDRNGVFTSIAAHAFQEAYALWDTDKNFPYFLPGRIDDATHYPGVESSQLHNRINVPIEAWQAELDILWKRGERIKTNELPAIKAWVQNLALEARLENEMASAMALNPAVKPEGVPVAQLEYEGQMAIVRAALSAPTLMSSQEDAEAALEKIRRFDFSTVREANQLMSIGELLFGKIKLIVSDFPDLVYTARQVRYRVDAEIAKAFKLIATGRPNGDLTEPYSFRGPPLIWSETKVPLPDFFGIGPFIDYDSGAPPGEYKPWPSFIIDGLTGKTVAVEVRGTVEDYYKGLFVFRRRVDVGTPDVYEYFLGGDRAGEYQSVHYKGIKIIKSPYFREGWLAAVQLQDGRYQLIGPEAERTGYDRFYYRGVESENIVVDKNGEWAIVAYPADVSGVRLVGPLMHRIPLKDKNYSLNLRQLGETWVVTAYLPGRPMSIFSNGSDFFSGYLDTPNGNYFIFVLPDKTFFVKGTIGRNDRTVGTFVQKYLGYDAAALFPRGQIGQGKEWAFLFSNYDTSLANRPADEVFYLIGPWAIENGVSPDQKIKSYKLWDVGGSPVARLQFEDGTMRMIGTQAHLLEGVLNAHPAIQDLQFTADLKWIGFVTDGSNVPVVIGPIAEDHVGHPIRLSHEDKGILETKEKSRIKLFPRRGYLFYDAVRKSLDGPVARQFNLLGKIFGVVPDIESWEIRHDNDGIEKLIIPGSPPIPSKDVRVPDGASRHFTYRDVSSVRYGTAMSDLAATSFPRERLDVRWAVVPALHAYSEIPHFAIVHLTLLVQDMVNHPEWLLHYNPEEALKIITQEASFLASLPDDELRYVISTLLLHSSAEHVIVTICMNKFRYELKKGTPFIQSLGLSPDDWERVITGYHAKHPSTSQTFQPTIPLPLYAPDVQTKMAEFKKAFSLEENPLSVFGRDYLEDLCAYLMAEGQLTPKPMDVEHLIKPLLALVHQRCALQRPFDVEINSSDRTGWAFLMATKARHLPARTKWELDPDQVRVWNEANQKLNAALGPDFPGDPHFRYGGPDFFLEAIRDGLIISWIVGLIILILSPFNRKSVQRDNVLWSADALRQKIWAKNRVFRDVEKIDQAEKLILEGMAASTPETLALTQTKVSSFRSRLTEGERLFFDIANALAHEPPTLGHAAFVLLNFIPAVGPVFGLWLNRSSGWWSRQWMNHTLAILALSLKESSSLNATRVRFAEIFGNYAFQKSKPNSAAARAENLTNSPFDLREGIESDEQLMVDFFDPAHIRQDGAPSRRPVPGTGNGAPARAYAPGDDVRTINWRAAGRSDHLYVNEPPREVEKKTAIVIDLHNMKPEDGDLARSLAVFLNPNRLARDRGERHLKLRQIIFIRPDRLIENMAVTDADYRSSTSRTALMKRIEGRLTPSADPRRRFYDDAQNNRYVGRNFYLGQAGSTVESKTTAALEQALRKAGIHAVFMAGFGSVENEVQWGETFREMGVHRRAWDGAHAVDPRAKKAAAGFQLKNLHKTKAAKLDGMPLLLVLAILSVFAVVVFHLFVHGSPSPLNFIGFPSTGFCSSDQIMAILNVDLSSPFDGGFLGAVILVGLAAAAGKEDPIAAERQAMLDKIKELTPFLAFYKEGSKDTYYLPLVDVSTIEKGSATVVDELNKRVAAARTPTDLKNVLKEIRHILLYRAGAILRIKKHASIDSGFVVVGDPSDRKGQVLGIVGGKECVLSATSSPFEDLLEANTPPESFEGRATGGRNTEEIRTEVDVLLEKINRIEVGLLTKMMSDSAQLKQTEIIEEKNEPNMMNISVNLQWGAVHSFTVLESVEPDGSRRISVQLRANPRSVIDFKNPIFTEGNPLIYSKIFRLKNTGVLLPWKAFLGNIAPRRSVKVKLGKIFRTGLILFAAFIMSIGGLKAAIILPSTFKPENPIVTELTKGMPRGSLGLDHAFAPARLTSAMEQVGTHFENNHNLSVLFVTRETKEAARQQILAINAKLGDHTALFMGTSGLTPLEIKELADLVDPRIELRKGSITAASNGSVDLEKFIESVNQEHPVDWISSLSQGQFDGRLVLIPNGMKMTPLDRRWALFLIVLDPSDRVFIGIEAYAAIAKMA